MERLERIEERIPGRRQLELMELGRWLLMVSKRSVYHGAISPGITS